MSFTLDSILYIVCLSALVVPAGIWIWRMLGSPLRLHRSLALGYAAFVVSALCDSLNILNICVAESFERELQMSLLTVGVLFLPPVLVLLQQAIIDGRSVGCRTILLHLSPSILYTVFVVYIRLFYGLDHIVANPWMLQVELIGYYYILILNIFVGLFLLVWRYRKYHFKVCNYYPDRSRSDDSSVRDLTVTFLLIGAVVYFFLFVSQEKLNHNWAATVVLVAIISFIFSYLGHALCRVKGNAIPADFDLSTKTLTAPEIASFEQRYKQASELLSAEKATKDISSTIEQWVEQSEPSYLRAGITRTEAAYEMNIPASILSGYINKTLGTNFNQWINSYRIRHVKYLLLTADSTLDEIAEATGFATRNLLSRTFKAHEGISPSEYRSQNKKK